MARLLPQKKQVIAASPTHSCKREGCRHVPPHTACMCSDRTCVEVASLSCDDGKCPGWSTCRFWHSALPVLQKYGEEYTVTGIDKEAKVATLACGQKIQYEALVSTMPLDLTLHRLGQPKWAEELSHRWVSCHLTAHCCLLIAGRGRAATLQTHVLSAAILPAVILS